MADVYLIVLEGQGDLNIKVVDQITWDWIVSDDLGTSESEDCGSWVDTTIPECQRQLIQAAGDDPNNIEITIGSYNNDRAIFAQSTNGYTTYSSVKSLFDAVITRGDTVIDEYQGCIY